MADASCPKCGTARVATRTHCATCGLAHDKMGAFARARDAVPDVLGTAWERALAGWEDHARHDELLRLVTQHDAYAWAAARYRDRLAEHTTDAMAHQQLARVRKAAEAQLLAQGAQRDVKMPRPYRGTIAMLAVLVIMILALVVYMIVRSTGSEAPPASRPPPGATN